MANCYEFCWNCNNFKKLIFKCYYFDTFYFILLLAVKCFLTVYVVNYMLLKTNIVRKIGVVFVIIIYSNIKRNWFACTYNNIWCYTTIKRWLKIRKIRPQGNWLVIAIYIDKSCFERKKNVQFRKILKVSRFKNWYQVLVVLIKTWDTHFL